MSQPLWPFARLQTPLPLRTVNAREALNWLAFGSADDSDLVAEFDAEKRQVFKYPFPNAALGFALREAAEELTEDDHRVLAGLTVPPDLSSVPPDASRWKYRPGANRDLTQARQHAVTLLASGDAQALHERYRLSIGIRAEMERRLTEAGVELLRFLKDGTIQAFGRPAGGLPIAQTIPNFAFSGTAGTITPSSCLTAYGQVVYSDMTFDLRPLSEPEGEKLASKVGRPPGYRLVQTEMERRATEKTMFLKIGLECEHLSAWLAEKHPDAVQMKWKSIAARLRGVHRILCQKL